MSKVAGSERHSLDPILDPASVVVVGASADPAKRGYQILRALGESGYRGKVFAVNPRGGEILGREVFPSIEALPEPVDLAVLCTPAGAAPDLVRACGARGIAGAVVLAVGFGESGTAGRALEAELVAAGQASGVRIIGPNTSGLLNLPKGLNLIGARGIRPGGIALLVQSGNMALALMNEVTERSWAGISVCLGVGNAADVGFGEALEWLGEHDDTRAVIVYVEGFKDARGFLEVASRVSRTKPVIVIKSARTSDGAAAAQSHTGSVAGPYDRLRAGFRQAGVVEVTRTDELLHVAESLAHQPSCSPEAGIAILSDGGGQGTLVVDALSESGARLSALSAATQSQLRNLLGPAAGVSNPVDLAGAADADPLVFAAALDVLSADPDVGTVLLVGLFGGYGIRFAERLGEGEAQAAEAMAARMRQRGKGLVVHSMYAGHRSAPLAILGEQGVPVVGSLDVACRCVTELQARGRDVARLAWPAAGALPDESTRPPVPAIVAAREENRTTLSEPEARALLSDFGVVFPEAYLVSSADEAAAVVERLGRSVAVKAVSKRIIHKSDVGGVALNVEDRNEARAAFELNCGRVAARAEELGLPREAPSALVTPMLDRPLMEMLVGAQRDPVLGPVLTIGAGGIWVELLADVAHRVLPVTDDDIRGMVDELVIGAMLRGARGQQAGHIDGVVQVATAIAQFLLAVPEVQEVEINPLFVYSDRVAAVDARVTL
ncbi:MAG: acetate--CoA ligase family protein [Gemmatimonadetes bacterium]|nr:acetate--CoA ligase family protein [Gemmatimonadota bacterium]MDA1104510.1 acetate--CoA ligase family protein [Gemmatimonadota bacterium]